MRCSFGIMEKVLGPAFVRAIAIGDGDQKVLLIAYDLIGVPDPTDAIKRLPKLTGLPAENILLFATHAHATPAEMCIRDSLCIHSSLRWRRL